MPSYPDKINIINDPIYGFITIPNDFISDLIQHPYFQRLRRISQMGMSYLVYPGAHHTRFHHALGAMHLMQKAIEIIKKKKVKITKREENALLAAILLHDIGHGPFSHALEKSLVKKEHEEISLLFMESLNNEFKGKLDLTIQIFRGNYHRKFMLQLISSQLDMDRMDYLKRDSFYTGVAEGNINSDRLIQMLNVKDDTLVIEEKGIYCVEKFLMARRLMYWQVYLHKTSLVAELILNKTIKRARNLLLMNHELTCSQELIYFLNKSIKKQELSDQELEHFSRLDDFDIISALKEWQNNPDPILSELSRMLLNRDLLRIRFSEEKFSKSSLIPLLDAVAQEKKISIEQASYFVFSGKVINQAYKNDMEPVRMLNKDHSVENALDASDQLSLKAMSKPVIRHYLCYPKHIKEK